MEQKQRSLHGAWMGCRYGLGGDRTEWTLSLATEGRYCRTEVHGGQPPSEQSGRFEYDETDDVIACYPDNGSESVQYSVRDVTGLERANTLLILRWIGLASRNLPIMLYRVYHDPHGLGLSPEQSTISLT